MINYITTQTTNASGWVYYADTEYSESSSFVVLANTWTSLPNNANTIVDLEKPNNKFTTFYDKNTQLLVVNNVGDAFTLSVTFTVRSSQSSTNIDFGINIGGSFGIIFPREITANKSAGIPKEKSFTMSGYQLGVFKSNGGSIQINAEHDVEIWGVSYIVTRLHTGQ